MSGAYRVDEEYDVYDDDFFDDDVSRPKKKRRRPNTLARGKMRKDSRKGSDQAASSKSAERLPIIGYRYTRALTTADALRKRRRVLQAALKLVRGVASLSADAADYTVDDKEVREEIHAERNPRGAVKYEQRKKIAKALTQKQQALAMRRAEWRAVSPGQFVSKEEKVAWQYTLQKLLDHSLHAFVDRVDETVARDYYTVIKSPMWLARVADRLKSGYYRERSSTPASLFALWKSEISTVWRNAEIYNPPVHPLHCLAKQQSQMMDQEIAVFERAYTPARIGSAVLEPTAVATGLVGPPVASVASVASASMAPSLSQAQLQENRFVDDIAKTDVSGDPLADVPPLPRDIDIFKRDLQRLNLVARRAVQRSLGVTAHAALDWNSVPPRRFRQAAVFVQEHLRRQR